MFNLKLFLAGIFTRSEIIPEVVISCLHKLPDEVTVAFKKEGGFLIGRIQLKGCEDPIFIQASTPAEFTKMLNEAIYIAHDFKNEYIDFFHKKGDRYAPTPEAKKALEEISGKIASGFERVFDFESGDAKKFELA